MASQDDANGHISRAIHHLRCAAAILRRRDLDSHGSSDCDLDSHGSSDCDRDNANANANANAEYHRLDSDNAKAHTAYCHARRHQRDSSHRARALPGPRPHRLLSPSPVPSSADRRQERHSKAQSRPAAHSKAAAPRAMAAVPLPTTAAKKGVPTRAAGLSRAAIEAYRHTGCHVGLASPSYDAAPVRPHPAQSADEGDRLSGVPSGPASASASASGSASESASGSASGSASASVSASASASASASVSARHRRQHQNQGLRCLKLGTRGAEGHKAEEGRVGRKGKRKDEEAGGSGSYGSGAAASEARCGDDGGQSRRGSRSRRSGRGEEQPGQEEERPGREEEGATLFLVRFTVQEVNEEDGGAAGAKTGPGPHESLAGTAPQGRIRTARGGTAGQGRWSARVELERDAGRGGGDLLWRVATQDK